MIDPCIKCVERDRCEGMNQPCQLRLHITIGKEVAKRWLNIQRK